jgi:hypothetical protein
VKLVGGDTSAFMSSATIVQPGYSYGFSGFVQVPGLVGGSFVLQFTTLLGGAVGSPELLPVYYSGSSYREYTRWVTAPDSATFLTVSIATLPNVTAYVDDVTVEDTTVAGVEEERDRGTKGSRDEGVSVRKVVGLWVDAERAGRALGTVPMRAQSLFDPLGRRVSGRPSRGGVYFVMPER